MADSLPPPPPPPPPQPPASSGPAPLPSPAVPPPPGLPPYVPVPAPLRARPVYRRPWFIAAAVLVLLAVIGGAAGAGKGKKGGGVAAATTLASTSTAAPAAVSSAEASTTPTPTTAAAPTAAPATTATTTTVPATATTEPPTTTTTVPPTTTTIAAPQVYDGQGDDIVNIAPNVDDGVALLHVVGNSGSRYFSVNSYDVAGKDLDLHVNTTDPYDGVTLLSGHAVQLEVKAIGPWHIEIVSVLTMPRFDKSAVGHGDQVYFYEGGPGTAHVVCSGDGYFSVKLYGGGSSDLLVNDIGPYDGRVRVRTKGILEVKGRCDWSFDLV